MRGTLALTAHSLRRTRGFLLLMGGVLGGFQLLLALAATTLYETGTFSQLVAFVPPIVREVVGPAFFSVASFAGVVAIGYFHFAVTTALVAFAIAVGTEVAGEIELGFADLLLSRPIARRAVIFRSALLLVVGLTALVATMLAGTCAGQRWIAPSDVEGPALGLILSLAANLWALALCWGSLALVVGAASRRRSVAGALTGLAALALLMLDYLAQFWRPARSIVWLSPFHYYSGMDRVMGEPLPGAHLAVLLATAAVGFAAALAIYSRRNL